jgi:Cu2+-exporting ATPase
MAVPMTPAALAAETTSTANTELAVLDDPVERQRFTRWVAQPSGERLAESSLQLAGLHCAACAGLIEQALRATPGVQGASVSAATQRALVLWDPARTQASRLIAAVRGAGYDAAPDAAAPARALRRQEARGALWRLFVAGFCSMQIMMLATPAYVAEAGELAPDTRALLNWASWLLALPVMLFSAGPFFRGAWHAVRRRRIGMDVPVALGIGIAFVASSAATFDPQGPFGAEVWFDSLTMFVALLLGARWVEMGARHRAAEALEASLARLPESAWRVAGDGSVEALAAHRLRPGEHARVPHGEPFPADGTLLAGGERVDEALLSGESTPRAKRAGDAVLAGSVNRGAPALMRVEQVGADTRYQAIVAMMKSAADQRPGAAALADRWAGAFLWTVLLLAAAAAAAWSFIDPTRALPVAVAVLIVTCPCALSLAAPATLVAASQALMRRGIGLSRLAAVEGLARARRVFFDKTGTLTLDTMRVAGAHLTEPGRAVFAGEQAARGHAAALAAFSTHPLSRALADGRKSDVHAVAWSAVHEHPGQGLAAFDDQGREWRLGSLAWAGGDAAAGLPGRVALARDGTPLATFDFEEALREGAAEAVRALRDAGLCITLLSGDRAERARALALRLGIDDVIAEATPESKLAAVAASQRRGERVVMVGDGVNDAPVLARADVSVALADGAGVARAQADAVLGSGDLRDLARARVIAERALAIVRQNLAWASVYNALCIPLALVGWLPPWAAGIGMAASSLLVVLNAARAAR